MTDLVVLGLSAARETFSHLRETGTPFLLLSIACSVASLWALAMARRQPQRSQARAADGAALHARGEHSPRRSVHGHQP